MRASPVMVGGDAGCGLGEAATTAVEALVALALPPRFVAVTTTRRREPVSATTGLYVRAVAPTIGAQAGPCASQRSHWYVYAVGALVQAPADAVNVNATCAVPVTVGAVVFAGTGGGAIIPDGELAATPDPPAFVAVTRTRTVCW